MRATAGRRGRCVARGGEKGAQRRCREETGVLHRARGPRPPRAGRARASRSAFRSVRRRSERSIDRGRGDV